MVINKEEFENWLEKHPKTENFYYTIRGYSRRIYDKVEFIFLPKHKLEREHRAIGLTYWDRPPLRFDGFAADSVLAWVMYPILVRFRDSEKMGTPMEFYNEETGHCDDDAWQEVLNKITLAFELKIVDDWQNGEEYKSMYAKIDEGLALFTKYYHNLWD